MHINIRAHYHVANLPALAMRLTNALYAPVILWKHGIVSEIEQVLERYLAEKKIRVKLNARAPAPCQLAAVEFIPEEDKLIEYACIARAVVSINWRLTRIAAEHGYGFHLLHGVIPRL
jgi:hypothetical protein